MHPRAGRPRQMAEFKDLDRLALDTIARHLQDDPCSFAAFRQTHRAAADNRRWPQALDKGISHGSRRFMDKLFKALIGMHRFTSRAAKGRGYEEKVLTLSVRNSAQVSADAPGWKFHVDVEFGPRQRYVPFCHFRFGIYSYHMISRVTGERVDVPSVFRDSCTGKFKSPHACLGALKRLILSNPVLAKTVKQSAFEHINGPALACVEDAIQAIARTPKPVLMKPWLYPTYGDAKLADFIESEFTLVTGFGERATRHWDMRRIDR